MKRYIKATEQNVFGMANLTPRRTGLSCDIWSDHRGCERTVEHNYARVKVGTPDVEVVVMLEPYVHVDSWPSKTKHADKQKINEAVEYIRDNVDLFLKHFYDTHDKDEFDDTDLFDALRDRGVYK